MTERTRRRVAGLALTVLLIVWTWLRIRSASSFLEPYGFPYLRLADLILSGVMPYHELTDVSPLYLWFMVALRGMGLSEWAIRGLQIASLTLSAVCCALAAKRLAGWSAAIGAAVLILGNRAALVVCTQLDPKALLFLLTAAAFALLIPERDRLLSTTRVAIGAVLLGLAAVGHPYGYLVWLALLVTIRRRALLVALVPVAVFALVTQVLVPPALEGHSSSQFFEGNNVLATGAGGVPPRIVEEIEPNPQARDRVYRLLAADWRAQALAGIREYPAAAAKRFAWKALLTVHNFDVHDLVGSKAQSLALARWPAVPVGAAAALAMVGLLLFRTRRELWPMAAVSLILVVALTAFVVNARQRNLLLVPLSILGGVGVAQIVRLARERSEQSLLAFGGVLIVTTVLGIEGRSMREHQYEWLHRAEPGAPETLFDHALRLQARGAWREAEIVLASIRGYRPARGNHAVSSVAYYRVRSALQLRVPPTVVRELLEQALLEAPGDPWVLALRAVTFDPDAAETLRRLHDPYLRDYALALAYHDLGNEAEARRRLESLARRLPQWEKPRQILRATTMARTSPGGATGFSPLTAR
jgi:hypothetical protein